MAPSDFDLLLDMGFETDRAELAVKKTSGLQEAIDWLDKNQDKTIEEIRAEDDEGPAADINPEDEARSLVCDDCGKKFRTTAQAEFHASKAGHENFSESIEEIKPLTEEERKAKLEELKQKLAEKRATQSEQDKMDRRRNEEIRRKATKESQDIREELQRKERIKEAQAKKREKMEEVEARKRVLAKLEADKQERRRKAEEEKAARAGHAVPSGPHAPQTASPAEASTSKPAAAYTETRLRLQTPNGMMQKSFPVETTLFEVAQAIAADNGFQVSTFTTNFPRKTFDHTDFGQTLKEAGMVPSAALIVK